MYRLTLQLISNSGETYTKTTLGATKSIQPGEQKILEVTWDTISNRFRFRFGEIAILVSTLEPKNPHIVSIVGRIYDPVGLL